MHAHMAYFLMSQILQFIDSLGLKRHETGSLQTFVHPALIVSTQLQRKWTVSNIDLTNICNKKERKQRTFVGWWLLGPLSISFDNNYRPNFPIWKISQPKLIVAKVDQRQFQGIWQLKCLHVLRCILIKNSHFGCYLIPNSRLDRHFAIYTFWNTVNDLNLSVW